ncbi:MAG TPA: winged helix-turn-helix domain-containing protein, partial [Acetobacteraceae bacterium]
MIFAFDDCALDVERRELRRGGAPVVIEPQVFDLLVHLICNRHRVVSKNDLIETIWGSRIVSEADPKRSRNDRPSHFNRLASAAGWAIGRGLRDPSGCDSLRGCNTHD